MARRTEAVPIPPSRSPELILILQRGERFEHCVAKVDGQAQYTLLPIEIAHGLGFGRTQIRPNLRKVTGPGGIQIRTWSVSEPIEARVGAEIDGKSKFIGPELQLVPLFFKTKKRKLPFGPVPIGRSLLGRKDFYEVFEVNDRGSEMILSWEEIDVVEGETGEPGPATE